MMAMDTSAIPYSRQQGASEGQTAKAKRCFG